MNQDNIRLILLLALGFVLFLIWQAWEQDHATTVPAQTTTQQTPNKAADVPAGVAATEQAAPAATASATPGTAATLASAQRVHVVTDLFDAEIDTIGGDLRRLDLLAYAVAANKPNEPFRLMTEAAPKLFIAQTGLLADANVPDHHAVFSAAQTQYRLADGADELKVRLHWVSPEGVPVDKTYTFTRASYEVKIDYVLHNTTAQEVRGRMYGQFQRVDDSASQSKFIYTYTGGVISSAENKYEKITFDQIVETDLSREIKGGWAAMLQHYFVGAWIPPVTETSRYYTKAIKEGVETTHHILGLVTAERAIKPGETATLGLKLYAGPKLQDQLKEIAPGLELTVDYGLLTVLAQPLFWLLEYIHGVVKNWGWSIVLLTLLIKLVFYHLSAASYRSMANMRRLQPRIVSIRERHGDDRQRMSQAMMELYKTEKINPLGGCLPVLVQIPVFIALYWVLLESVELRQADFIFWLNDLSSKDPYYVLPLLMGITMFIQMKLSPAPPDPLQAKVMMALPVIFTFFFAFFPSGLVLYWVVNNALSILQQWHITRKIIGS